MSGNPNQKATGGQPMRYTPQFQSMQPQLQTRDSFQLTNQNYVQQQPNQAGNQGAGLRGIAQTGPPNQAPTPPNQDLKVQTVPQQAPMNLYQQSAVRPTQQYNFRPPGPPNQTPRMANNQHRGQQQIYPATPPTQYVPVPMQNMYMNPMPYFNSGQQRQNFVQQPVALLQSQHFAPFQAYTHTPTLTQTPPTVTYQYYSAMPRAAGPPPQPTSTPSNPNQTPIPSMPLPQPIAPQQPMSRQTRRRANAIPIIDPNTGVNKLDEIYEDSSHPPSGESSARQTPQPAPHNPSKEVQATFAKQVAQVLHADEDVTPSASASSTSYEEDRHSSTGEHMEPPPAFHPPPQQAVHSSAKYDIVQTSKLKVQAKEFSPSSKETPVVSAICDSEEVTLPNKQPSKGRESPAKGRKKDTKDHHREPTKDVQAPKEAHPAAAEKQLQAPVVKEEAPKPKETIVVTVPAPVEQQVVKSGDKEADKRKKEIKSDPKPVEVNAAVNVCEQASPNRVPEPSPPVNAKSKQNASQRKEAQKSNQKSTSPNVPPPQPTKASSKTSKKNEINNKGASKEGTEMDVFQIADTVNANLAAPPTNNSDVINANTMPDTIETVVAPPDVVVNSNSNAVDCNDKTNESNEPATIKPAAEVKPAPTKWQVMNVFGGKVPTPPPYAHTAAASNRDETDRAALSNDKLIQAKNEANAAKTVNATNVIETKPELPYKEGQWSPSNLEGNKKYDKDFLLAARSLPMSNIKPDIPDGLDNSGSRVQDNRYAMRSDFTTPPFMSPFGGKNSSMKGSITKHSSFSGKVNNKGMKSTNGGGNKISISLREEIKLHETENAWKPGRLAKVDTRTDEEKKTEDLYKKVRGVLNKLTPQKFDTLLKQIKSLKVDTVDRLSGVINLIFEKALDEPNFSVAYARMCKELSDLQVTSGPNTEVSVNFRKILINRCQEEFEKQTKDESTSNEKMKEIEGCADPDKKKDLEFELEEIYRRIRMRSVGNVRFIGELFKIKMLTANIMLTCLSILLSNKDEESLECLCKLLSTVGKDLEDNLNKDLTNFFNVMQDIVDKKHMNCSSRIRFMLKDAIDLRRNKWIPRRQDLKPKTIDQIQKEAENEHLNQAINSVPNTPRRDERLGGDMNRGKPRNDDEWTTRTQRNKPFTLHKDKLKVKAPGEDEVSLGGSKMFSNWSMGSQYKPTTNASSSSFTTNKFAILDSGPLDSDKKLMGRYKDSAYTSKGSSLERPYGKQNYDNRAGSRSGSQHRMNEAPTLSVPQRMAPPMAPVAAPATPAKPAAAAAAASPAPEHSQLSEDQLERYFKNCLEEFINDNCTFDECDSDIRKTFPVNYMPRIVADGYLSVIEKFSTARLKTGVLFAKLIKVGTLPLQEYCVGIEEIFGQVEDLIIDIPTIWSCLAEILAPVICEEALPLNRLQKCCEVLISNGVADKLLAAIFKLIVTERGPNFLKNLWHASSLQFTSFMPDNRVEAFIKNNQFEFLTGGETLQGNSEFNYEQIEVKLLEFFNGNVDCDDIYSWITANVGERVKENQFIRTLATAIYKYSIVRTKLDPERLSKHYRLFTKYVDNNQAYELQCLYALQSLVHQMEYPQGLLLAIFTKLNEDVIFPQESFIAWESSSDPAEQEGKGVATKLLTSFFTQLRENEEDEDDYASENSEEA